MTKKTIIPTREKLINAPAGPPSWSALPELTSNPGPIIPRQPIRNPEHHRPEPSRHTSDSNHLQMPRLQLSLQRLCKGILAILATRLTPGPHTLRVAIMRRGPIGDGIEIILVRHGGMQRTCKKTHKITRWQPRDTDTWEEEFCRMRPRGNGGSRGKCIWTRSFVPDVVILRQR